MCFTEVADAMRIVDHGRFVEHTSDIATVDETSFWLGYKQVIVAPITHVLTAPDNLRRSLLPAPCSPLPSPLSTRVSREAWSGVTIGGVWRFIQRSAAASNRMGGPGAASAHTSQEILP